VVYRVEPALTYAEFAVSHLGVFTQRGHFDRTSGRIELDAGRQTGSIDLIVDAASVNTGWNLRDAFVRGEHMFDAEHFPVLRFRSSHLLFTNGHLARIGGEITLRGVTRPILFTVVRTACGRRPADGRDACEAEATGVIHRSEFGMTFAQGLVGDDVQLHFVVTAFRAPHVGDDETHGQGL
jgi:polyisoprenoid-binding protein YceI